MHLYHASEHAEAILEQGFVDGDGFYHSGRLHRGVWLFDRSAEGGRPPALIQGPWSWTSPTTWPYATSGSKRIGTTDDS